MTASHSLSLSQCAGLPVPGLAHSLLYNIALLSLRLISRRVAEPLYEVDIVVTVHNNQKTGQLTRQMHPPY